MRVLAVLLAAARQAGAGDAGGAAAPGQWRGQLSEAHISDFNAWFANLSGSRRLTVEAVHLPDGRRLGLRAVEGIAQGDAFLVIPDEAVLGVESARRAPKFSKVLTRVRGFFGSDEDGTEELILHLLYERFVLREQSFWWPYLQILPATDELASPYFLGDQALRSALAGSGVLGGILHDRQKRRRQYEGTISKILEQSSWFHTRREAFAFANYEWAHAILDSRTFSWQEADGVVRKHLAPMLDIANTVEVDDSAALDDSVSRVRHAEGLAVAEAQFSFDVGDEVTISYGLPNIYYFMYFGFIIEHHPRDCVLWRCRTRKTVCLDRDSMDSLDNLVSIARVHLGPGSEGAENMTVAREFLESLEQVLGQFPDQAAPPAVQRELLAYRFRGLERKIIRHLIARVRSILGAADLGGDEL